MKSNSSWLFCLSIGLIVANTVQSAVVSSSETGNEAVNRRTARKEEGKWRVAGRFVGDCLETEDYTGMASCFAVKTVALMDRAGRMNNINVLPGISFVANNDISQEDLLRNGRALLSEEEIENSLASEPEKSSKLIDMLLESAARFIQTHSLQIRMPKASSEDLERAFDEGRAKLKKKFLPFLGILAVKIFALLPILLGTVGFLALKALIVGKIALIIAAVLALQKYTSSSGGSSNLSGFGKLTDAWNSPSSSNLQGWNSAAASPSGGYYRRSIEGSAPIAHQLAYSAQIPNETSESS